MKNSSVIYRAIKPPTLHRILIVRLDLGQVLHQPVHLAVLAALLVRKQRVQVLDERSLHRGVPRLGRPSAHRRHRFPVMIHVRNNVLILAEHQPGFTLLYRRLAQIGDGRNAHLRDRGLGFPERFQPRDGTVFAHKHIVLQERHQATQLEADA